MHPARATALLSAGALLAGSALRLGARWRRVRAEVPVELRAPMLLVPLALSHPAVVRLARRAPIRVQPMPGVVHQVRTAALPGREPVQLHLYRPEAATDAAPVVYWIHPGGFVIGSPAMDHGRCARMARELGAMVVSVDYRLAPEHPFPAPLEDCWTGVRWVHEHAADLGIDPTRVAVAGASAGAGLAACLAQLAQDRAGAPLAHQLLVYPMLDDRTVLREDHAGTGRFVWTPASNRYGWTSYLGRPPVAGTAPEYAAAARRADLTGLPPAWIGVGELDLFHAEDVRYADRLRAAGVPVQLVELPGMYHGADGSAPDAASMVAFTDSQLQALRRALSTPDPERATAGAPG